MFYTFEQNSSGGYFEKPAILVNVEADTLNEAMTVAKANGLYFNGVADGRDCECCGDRWSEPRRAPTPEPMDRRGFYASLPLGEVLTVRKR